LSILSNIIHTKHNSEANTAPRKTHRASAAPANPEMLHVIRTSPDPFLSLLSQGREGVLLPWKDHSGYYTNPQMYEELKNIYLEIAFSHLICFALSHCWFANGVGPNRSPNSIVRRQN